MKIRNYEINTNFRERKNKSRKIENPSRAYYFEGVEFNWLIRVLRSNSDPLYFKFLETVDILGKKSKNCRPVAECISFFMFFFFS